jgi:polygalacturonase
MSYSLRPLFLLAVAGWLANGSVARALPTLPLINSNNVIVVTNTAYGAVGDGVTDNTLAISNAIVKAAAGGATNGAAGGVVEIPAGVFMCGPLLMKSAVNLQIDAGAILRMLPYDTYPGSANFIGAINVTDVAISGPGAIDGQGYPWWSSFETNSALARPIMIRFQGCNRQLIQNITLSNSPMFHISVSSSRGNVTVQGVTIRAPASNVSPASHNTDACDVSGTNILVRNCDISVGDDNFTCGGGTSDVLISNNVYGSGHGVSIGSYTQGVSNIMVMNCIFNGTENGIRIKSDNDRSGLVRNISYLNIGMTNVHFPIQVYGYYNEVGTPSSISPNYAATQAVAAVVSTTPVYRDILFSNITATSISGYPIGIVWARTELPATNLVFNRVNITGNRNFCLYNVSGAQFIDCQLNVSATSNTFALFNSDAIFTNSVSGGQLFTFNGLTTNGYDNSLAFYNATGSLKNTNAFDNGPLTLSASTFTVSNNLSLAPSTILNVTLGTNSTRLAVVGDLVLGGTNNISAGAGFTNGTYPFITYTGALTGTLPTLGAAPSGFSYAYDTNTAGQVKLVVSAVLPLPVAPASLTAIATNGVVNLAWPTVNFATGYNVKRSLTSGSGYTVLAGIDQTNYGDAQITNGITYYYVVSSTNSTGESANSSEAAATPQQPAYLVVTTNVFSDGFTTSTLNSTTPTAPTPTNTSYSVISSKGWNPTPSLAGGHLKFGIGTTTSGCIEVQALFTNAPVTLATVGDSISLLATFTNTSGLLTQSSALGFGLYRAGTNAPVPGGLNGTAASNTTANATGNAQTWVGYVGQIAFTNSASQILTRQFQSGTGNNNQDAVTSGSGSSSYANPAGTTVGTASAAATVVLSAASACTEVLTITLTAPGTLAITNFLYSGLNTNGALLAQFGGVASGSTYLTNQFDALAIGWRATANTSATTIDLTRIAVLTTLTVPTTNNVTPLPAAPANLTASATNLLINLSWNSLAGATYNLKRSTTNGGPYPVLAGGLTTTNYADASVTNAVTYYYVVTAVTTAGESTNSLPVAAAPLPSSQPTNLVMQATSGQLQLSWPADHLGWRLQIQTNNLADGLTTNWVTVPGSTNVNTLSFPLTTTNGSVFLRLVYP